MDAKEYPNLRSFLSGWFHQDFDVVGDTIHDVVAEYKRVSPRAETHVVAAEIRALVSLVGNELEQVFRREFELDIEPTAFAPTVEAFLMQIAVQLEAE